MKVQWDRGKEGEHTLVCRRVSKKPSGGLVARLGNVHVVVSLIMAKNPNTVSGEQGTSQEMYHQFAMYESSEVRPTTWWGRSETVTL